MKKLLTSITLLTSLLIGCETGCKVAKGQYTPATGRYDTNSLADSFVVTAQNTREGALGVFDGLMTIEAHNEAVLKTVNPKIHEAAEYVRKNGKKLLDDLTASIAAYQNARTPENQSRMNSALAALDSAFVSASARLAESIKTTTKGTP